MTKVLQVPTTSHVWYQKALITSELEEIFANAPAAPNAVTNRRVQEAYARATGKAPATPAAESSSKRRMPTEDDDCPICYESMHKVAEANLAFCEECGNALHSACFAQCEFAFRESIILPNTLSRETNRSEVGQGDHLCVLPVQVAYGYCGLRLWACQAWGISQSCECSRIEPRSRY